MNSVLITGASGPIGAALLPSLKAERVVRLVRTPARGQDQVQWNPSQPLSPEVVSGCEVVIHLAGASIFTRWTAAKKKAILDSRVQGTTNLANAIVKAAVRPRVFICASAIGYYGDGGDRILTEDSPNGHDFLAEVCRAWEAASKTAADAGIRTVNLRMAPVLSPNGGALGAMLLPFRLGLGGRLGSGRQWMSWVHIDDLVAAVHHLIENEHLAGPVNMVSPTPVTDQEFTRTLASVLHRPALLPVPRFAAQLVFGEMADQVLLSGQRVLPTKLDASGYSFRFADLRSALQDLLG